jgi:hypothetical protein
MNWYDLLSRCCRKGQAACGFHRWQTDHAIERRHGPVILKRLSLFLQLVN